MKIKEKEIVFNKKIPFDYEIKERFEAGIVLKGPEVKSVKEGQVNLKNSYAVFHKDEIYLIGLYIAPYRKAGLLLKDYNPERPRKLLLRKEEINYLKGKLQERGLTLLPLRVYTKGSLIKIELVLGKGRKKIDKRELIKKREAKRRIKLIKRSF